MNEKEQLEQLVSDCEELLKRQQAYSKEPKDSPMKHGLLVHSKAQEKKIKEFCKQYRAEQQQKLEPSLFPE